MYSYNNIVLSLLLQHPNNLTIFLCLTFPNTSTSASTPLLLLNVSFCLPHSFLMAMISPPGISALYTVPVDPIPMTLSLIAKHSNTSSAVKFNRWKAVNFHGPISFPSPEANLRL
uniref:Uncharacterized protein n=1 Tax=Opuntia streptacantha TaxID=393608 RepID=A0A7C9AVD0_OPUST